ncbi:F0F1 ATP synthase subunit A [uncultured Clostridium sp.]|uniref:F0F1 ATP synthase subunit A n=1 Tax=uncultured Clostridium sp. TaxID=59620 RepID=UPI00261AF407|nr:F0F1 ATP synthase subunit A [uncultured Clostridium sp.]
MDVFGELFTLKLGGISISGDIVIQWGIMLVVIVTALLMVRGFKVLNPGKVQSLVEMGYEGLKGLVDENMGKDYGSYVPFVGTLSIFLFLINLSSMVGFESPTRNLSVVIGFTVITFVLVHGNAIKRNGVKEYVKSYGRPFLAMLPITLMEKLVFPLSLALRLFGNVLASTIVMELLYMGLSKLSVFAPIGLPILGHAFFDLFDGTIQTIIFVMLTIITIKLQAEE